MFRMRSLTALVLALMLGLTSLSLAAARGHAPAVGAIELCTGAGMQMLPVDADGNPTGPAHICPDGLAALAMLAVDAPHLPGQVSTGTAQPLPTVASVAGAPVLSAQARAPPVLSA